MNAPDPGLARLPGGLRQFIGHYLQHWRPYRDSWNYEDGIVWLGALALGEASGARKFSDFAYREVSRRIAGDGAIRGFRQHEFNIDNLKPGSSLLALYALDPEPRLRAAIEMQATQLGSHPRTNSGNYWHKQIYASQVWLDGLYMAQPFQCGYALLSGKPGMLEDTRRQFEQVHKVLRDPHTGLYWHGWDESRAERWSDPATGCSANFWGRAMGWYVMALVDCWEIAASASPALAHTLHQQLQEIATALLAVRSPGGLWYQLLDQPATPGNYEEASASLMISYALLKGARLGLLPETCREAGNRGFNACLDRFLRGFELNGICGVAGLGNRPYRDGSVSYYLSEAIVPNDPKGVAALLLASAEWLRLV